jgi:hypothetical protein
MALYWEAFHSTYFNLKSGNNGMDNKIKIGIILLAITITNRSMAQETGKLYFTTSFGIIAIQ